MGALPPITISLPVVFDNVIVSSLFKFAVTPEAAWLISVTKSDKVVLTAISSVFIVKVFDIVNVLFAADVSLLKAVAVAPWEFEFALIFTAKALAVLFPEERLSDKVEAIAFWPLILISLAPRFAEA